MVVASSAEGLEMSGSVPMTAIATIAARPIRACLRGPAAGGARAGRSGTKSKAPARAMG
jgi:hypothetical protein